MKIIIKIGTAAIYDSKKKRIKKKIIKQLAKDISKLIKQKHEVILVSSGAVGCGKKFISKKKDIQFKQASSSIGQVILMQKYAKEFSKYKIPVAQFLINSKDLNDKQRIKNIRETYNCLKQKAVPIVNENDVTSTEELKIGDNDSLASKLMLNLKFDLLIILTEIGALVKNKKQLLNSNYFSIEDYDKMEISYKGFGGLKTKLNCAKEITKKDKKCIIAKAGDSIKDILNKKVPCTELYQ